MYLGRIKMKSFPIESNYFITKVINFKKHKKNLLNLIDKMPINKYQFIANTDWNISKQHERTYQNYFLNNILNPYLNLFIKKLKVSKCTLHNFWFQQYNKDDFHDWHTHAGANYTNVFYIELPNKNMATEIKTLNNKIIKVDAKEGDILTFPAYLKHRSEPIKNEKRKTIISFNTSVDLQK